MSTTVTIQGTPIQFPVSGDSPNWAQATTDFATAVATALGTVLGASDVSPTSFLLDVTNNPTSNTSLPGLQFSTSTVRGAVVRYALYRATNSNNAAEAGTLTLLYNSNNATGRKWEMSREYVGDGQCSFNVTDAGQVQFSLATMSGSSHAGKIAYSATALAQ